VKPQTLLSLLTGILLLHPNALRAEAPKREVLANGIRVVLAPDSEAKFLTIVAFVRQSPPQTPQEAAVQELVARSLFFGSQNRSFDTVAASVRKVGGSLETHITPQFVAITCFTHPKQLKEGIYLISEALKNADFSPEALERAREIVKQIKQANTANTSEALRANLIRELLFCNDQALEYKRVNTALAQSYFKKHYRNEQIVLCLSGKFEPAQALRSVDNNLFEREALTLKTEKKQQDVPFPSIELTRNTADRQAHALVALEPPFVTSPNYPTALVIHSLLGVGHASRLFRHFREKQGIGYEVSASFDVHVGEPLIAQVQWDTTPRTPERPTPAQIQEQLLQQIIDIVDTPPSEAELHRAKQMAITRLSLSQERLRDRAFLLGWYEVMGVGIEFAEQLPNLIQGVTFEDFLRVAKTMISSRHTALLGPH
jgi:predicted Zn-dependent peptidase